MASISETMASANGLLREVVTFGIGFAGAALVAGVLFDLGGYDIVANVSGLVDKFVGGGLTGLITLLLFMSFMNKR